MNFQGQRVNDLGHSVT